MSTSDAYLYEAAMETPSSEMPFVSKKVLYAADMNNGVYSNGQIQLDTASLSNCGQFASYKDGWLAIPLVIRMTAQPGGNAAGVAGIQAASQAFAVGLKSGFWNLVHSISVEYNNTSVIQLTNLSNLYWTFKVLTTWDQNTLQKYGALYGFAPDGALSASYQVGSAASVSGHGSLNNNITSAVTATTSYANALASQFNSGLVQRMLDTSFVPATLPNADSGSPLYNVQNLSTWGKSYYSKPAASDSAYWYVVASVRLRDLSSFFNELDITRGSYLRFILNMNTASHTVNYVINAGALTDMSVTASQLANGSSPLVLCPLNTTAGINNLGRALIAAGDNTYTFSVSLSIAKDTITNQVNPALSQVRLYVPCYTLAPEFERNLISLHPTRTIVYRDIMQYTVPINGIQNGQQTFNTLLTNGVVAPKSIIICPMVGSASNPTGYAGAPANGANFVYPYQSPFASEPSTCSPYIYLSNFNVLVSGVNVFITNEQYSWENFKNELASTGAINGGEVDGFMSGLISYPMYQANYGYVVADISRRLEADDMSPKSIQITGTVLSSYNNVSLLVFVELERSVVISTVTGAKIE